MQLLEVAGSVKVLERLEVIRKLNAKREWINGRLYGLTTKEDLLIVAYERLKSQSGNMTPGSDDQTLDGFSMKTIKELSEELRTEKYRPKPVRTVYIPKANGKKRKLGIPSPKDKVVQEVVRMILEAVYESPHGAYFSDSSHGFRRTRSCHTALQEVQRKWSGMTWFVEGDISLRKMSHKKTKGFVRLMAVLNRKQIPVCKQCHLGIYSGKYDGLRLEDLAYDPSKSMG